MKPVLQKIASVVFISGLIIFSVGKAIAAPPPANNNCSGAILVSTITYNDLTTSYTDANTSGATASPSTPSCVTNNDNNDDIWYKFVAQTQTQLLRVHTVVSGVSYMTLGYALYDGCGGNQIYCNPGMATFYGNEMLGGLTPGNTYYLRFWSEGPFTTMSFSFAVMDISPITPGDDKAPAATLSINDPGELCINPQFYTTASATASIDPISCANASDYDDDVWFKFICPSNVINIYPEEGSLISTGAFADMGMEIYDAVFGSQSCTANYGVGSKTSFSGIAGNTYYIRIWTMGNTDRAVFSLCVQNSYDVSPSHVNNTCGTAINLTVGAGVCTNAVTGNLFDADITGALTGNPNCTVNTTLKNDVWYKATVPSTGNLVVQTSATHSAVNDLVLIAYTNNCTTFTQIACDEDGNTGVFPSAHHGRISLSGRTPGEIIFYRVLPRNTNNMGQFSICAFDESVPATPTISITDVRKNEGNSGTKQFNFDITLSSASASTVTVKYKTQDNTAVAPTDYASVNNTVVTFNPGETLKTVSVTVNGDVDVESNEDFKVKLSNPTNATIADNTGKGTIKNDDGVMAASPAAKTVQNKIAFAAKNFQVYPNPAKDKITIDLPVADISYTIIMTDLTGRTIKQQKVAAGQKNVSLNTSALSLGTYFLQVQYDGGTASLKFVKE